MDAGDICVPQAPYCKKSVDFTVKYLTSSCKFTYHYFHGRLLVNFCLRPDFTSKLVRELAFGTPKFYIAPYDKINHGLVNMSSDCDVKSGLRNQDVG